MRRSVSVSVSRHSERVPASCNVPDRSRNSANACSSNSSTLLSAPVGVDTPVAVGVSVGAAGASVTGVLVGVGVDSSVAETLVAVGVWVGSPVAETLVDVGVSVGGTPIDVGVRVGTAVATGVDVPGGVD